MIDDDTDDHEFFKMALNEVDSSINCLLFPDCNGALEHFSHNNMNAPRLVFIDINLPSVSGPECLVELQQYSSFDHPCIVIHSDSIPDEWHQSLRGIGVDKFVEKSASVPILIEKLKELLA